MHGGHAVHEAVRAFVERRGAWTLAAGPLPSHVLDVLKLAARAGDKLDQWSIELNIPPQRLAEIAGSFIENVLITPEASHYRVLGVAPDASEARITVHYNWLMQWLRLANHPPELRAELASRIKTAYRELSDVVRRATYDATMSEALAARLDHAVQPAQYDPRKTPGPAATAALRPREPEVPIQPAELVPQEVPAPADSDDVWHTETVFLDPAQLEEESGEPPALPPGVQWESRSDEVIALLTRPAAVSRPPPVRSRRPLVLAVLALAVAATLFFTQEQWRPGLEERLAQPAAQAPAADVPQPPAESPPTPVVVESVPREPPPAIQADAASAQVTASPEPLVVDQPELPPAIEEPAVALDADVASRAATPQTVAPETPPPATAEAQSPDPAQPPAARASVPVDPVVPAEARAAARRVADAYTAGDVVAVLNFVNRDGTLSQPEMAALAGDVERWWLERGGVALAITGTRALPPLQPGGAERAVVELRAPDSAGLRVVLRRNGLFWVVEGVLSIAPAASRNGGRQ